MTASSSSRRSSRTPTSWRRIIRHQFAGLFIVIEAPRGLDLRPYSDALYTALRSRIPHCLRVSDLGETPLAKTISPLLDEHPDEVPLRSESQILLRAAARAELVHHHILPALRSGSLVLCERFLWSTQVYQGTSIRDYELIRTLHRFTTDDLTPDYTFYLDRAEPIPSTQPLSAISHKDAFMRLASSDPTACSILDAAPSPLLVADAMTTRLQQHFEPLLTSLSAPICSPHAAVKE